MDDIILAIGRLRRSQPRNKDTMLVCDKLEALMVKPIQHPLLLDATVRYQATARSELLPRFDKKAYQRDYMRKRRAKNKTPD